MRKVLHNGDLLTVREFSEATGIQYKTVQNRIARGYNPLTGAKPLRAGMYQSAPRRYVRRLEALPDMDLGKAYFKNWPLVAAV